MNDAFRLETIALSDADVADGTAAHASQLFQKFWPRCFMDGAVDSSPAEESRVRCVHDDSHIKGCDVGLKGAHSRRHIQAPNSVTEGPPRSACPSGTARTIVRWGHSYQHCTPGFPITQFKIVSVQPVRSLLIGSREARQQAPFYMV